MTTVHLDADSCKRVRRTLRARWLEREPARTLEEIDLSQAFGRWLRSMIEAARS